MAKDKREATYRILGDLSQESSERYLAIYAICSALFDIADAIRELQAKEISIATTPNEYEIWEQKGS